MAILKLFYIFGFFMFAFSEDIPKGKWDDMQDCCGGENTVNKRKECIVGNFSITCKDKYHLFENDFVPFSRCQYSTGELGFYRMVGCRGRPISSVRNCCTGKNNTLDETDKCFDGTFTLGCTDWFFLNYYAEIPDRSCKSVELDGRISIATCYESYHINHYGYRTGFEPKTSYLKRDIVDCCKGDNVFVEYENGKYNCSEGDFYLSCPRRYRVHEVDEIPEYSCQTNSDNEMIILACFDEPDKDTGVLSILEMIIVILSICFIAVTIFQYLITPKNEYAIILIILVTVLITMICMIIIRTIVDLELYNCTFLAMCLYLYLMLMFTWINILAIKVYLNVNKHINKDPFWFYIYGFGLPILLLGVLILSYFETNFIGIAIGNCWFRTPLEIWIFYHGPLLILILSNCILMGLSYSQSYYYKFHCRIILYFSIIWTIEIISYNLKHIDCFYMLFKVLDYFNLSQGLFLFILLVICKPVEDYIIN